ncbi:hypothetical protein GCM10007424_22100 [Flavobacterium suaedae]|uniref:Uncharacterized protein n=1 Tax=Flavobacterium suaedae TaxID=1767027 RepID=A0ABQ1JZC2_9FLAO|nr:hypothetical protein [Flavobacterium suaedae]GGB81570.1 hypothetical protein GCM10007424_22100 [Flavobacterium suaedae]
MSFTNGIVINRSLVDTNWEIANQSLICHSTPTKLYIDIYKILNDGNNAIKAAWLKANCNHIDCEESTEHIQNAHLISQGDMPANPNYVTVYLKEIKDFINQNGGHFDNNSYEKYLMIELYPEKPDPKDRIVLTLLNQFDVNTSSVCCYSLAFLRSLKKFNGLNDTSVVNFAKDGNKIFICITDSNNSLKYYDVADNPQ